jgi:hypothetical protein
MKIYAKQVMPEYQESPLFMDEWPENVYVFGNRHFRDHGGEYIKNIKNSMYDAAYELKQLTRGLHVRGYSLTEILCDFLPAENGREYSRADRLEWRALLLNFDAGAITDDDAITTALQLITGREYDAAQICGCCQDDWNNIIYPSEYGREWLENFEIEYFNLGAEWRISEGDPDSDDNYYIYTHAWNEDGQRAEIAAAAGVDPADVVLYVFDGYTKTANYRTVTA